MICTKMQKHSDNVDCFVFECNLQRQTAIEVAAV